MVVETVLVLFSFINIDYLSVFFILFLFFIFWKTYKKINGIIMSLAVYRLIDNLNDKSNK